MREVKYWESFDGVQFDNEEDCALYEQGHILFDNSRIQFYSNNGNFIADPCESVLLDSNRFKVFDDEALSEYIQYCNGLNIKAPDYPSMPTPYPLHYRFISGFWECIEDEIMKLNYALKTDFDDTVIEEEEGRHDLADNG